MAQAEDVAKGARDVLGKGTVLGRVASALEPKAKPKEAPKKPEKRENWTPPDPRTLKVKPKLPAAMAEDLWHPKRKVPAETRKPARKKAAR